MKLKVEKLYKSYGKKTVVNGVNLDVSQGEIVGLLGPNGAGKTTTFYSTVGLINPDDGLLNTWILLIGKLMKIVH